MLVRAASSDGRLAPGTVDAEEWGVLTYDGLPNFGPHPDLDELLVYLDAVDDYGAPFEKLWASQRFGSVLQAADLFADTYQGSYADAGAWTGHYLALIGETTGPNSISMLTATRRHPRAMCGSSPPTMEASMRSGPTDLRDN